MKIKNISKTLNQIKNTPLPLIGFFQKKNLSMAVVAAQICGLKNNRISKIIKKIKNIDGRLELVKKFPNNIKVYVDYAHTPDALSEAIISIKETYGKNFSLVFGCGGERDKKKRSLMAKVARLHCKKIYVTDDNPRKENPNKIRKEIIKNLKKENFFNIANRSKAIKEAVRNAEPEEVILITGKGHENYQDYGNKIISISDKEIVKDLKINKDHSTKEKSNFLINNKILNTIIKKNKFLKFDGVTIDSRDIKKNNLFLALKGKNNDGNEFTSEAIKKGASYYVSSKINEKYKNKFIKVNNVMSFLNKFAILKRENSHAKILAITGSAGKTSLKNLLYILLKKFGATHASPRSFNNHFGVPLSLSNLNLNHKFGIFEVGMSKAGEINQLSKMIKPSLGIITNVGEAHIENFKNTKGIAKAKSEIINNIENNGTIILNHDDKFFNFLSRKAKLRNIRVISFGKNKTANVHIVKMKKIKNINHIAVKVIDTIFELKIKNLNIYNILCSLAVLKELELNISKIIKLYFNFEPSKGRGKIHNIRRYKRKFTLIDESYNANPLSVKNAINNFSAIKKNKSKKYLLLGDMLELGNKSEVLHKNLSKLINRSDIDKVFIKGEKTLFTYKNLKKSKRGNIFQCNQDIDETLKNIITNNDYLMIKGSNATGLNNISSTMIKGS